MSELSTSTSNSTTNEAQESNYRLPSSTALQHAGKISIVQDKPIMLDYWVDSLSSGGVIIGVKSDGEKLLVKSEDEYTSPISKIYKVETEYLIETENSFYAYLFTISAIFFIPFLFIPLWIGNVMTCFIIISVMLESPEL